MGSRTCSESSLDRIGISPVRPGRASSDSDPSSEFPGRGSIPEDDIAEPDNARPKSALLTGSQTQIEEGLPPPAGPTSIDDRMSALEKKLDLILERLGL